MSISGAENLKELNLSIGESDIYVIHRAISLGDESNINVTNQAVNGGTRLAENLIDQVVFFVGGAVIFRVIGGNYLSKALSGIALDLFWILMFILYYIVMEGFCQQTVGKMLMKTIVVNGRLENPTMLQIIGRTFTRFVPLDALSFLFGRRGWHDTWSNTMVISKSTFNYRAQSSELRLLKGEHDKAIACCKKAIAKAPYDVGEYLVLARVYNDMEEWDKAIAILEKALTLSANSKNRYPQTLIVQLYNIMAIACNGKGNHIKAVELCNEAIELEPNKLKTYFILGFVYRNNKSYIEALETYQKMLLLKQNSAAVYYQIGNTYLEQNDIPKAKEMLEKSMQSGYNPAFEKLQIIKQNINQ